MLEAHKKQERLKPPVMEDPKDLNAATISSTQPGRVQTAQGNGQARSL